MVFGSTSSIGPNTGGLNMQLSPQQTQYDSGMDWGNMFASAMPALGSLLTSSANIVDLKAKSEAIETNMASAVTSYQHSSDISYEQLDDLDRAVGDKMTNEGMNTMVAEARLRAASAETGGVARDYVTKAGRMQQSLNNAATIRQARNSKIGILRQMSTDKLNLDNQLTSLASSMSASPSLILNKNVQTFI